MASSNQIVWFVDDTTVQRYALNENPGGDETLTLLFDGVRLLAINGALYIANLRTGQLFLRILHASTWFNRVGDWSEAEEVVALIRSLPADERPKQIVVRPVSDCQMLYALPEHLVDFRDIVVIRGGEMQPPLGVFSSVDKFKDLIAKATETKTVLLNLYDDWLASISPYAAFCRFNFITRAIAVNRERTWLILKPNDTTTTEADHIWPTHTDEEWTNIEAQLKDLIVGEEE